MERREKKKWKGGKEKNRVGREREARWERRRGKGV